MRLGALGAPWSVPASAKAAVSLQMAPVGQRWGACHHWAGSGHACRGTLMVGHGAGPLSRFHCCPQRGVVSACCALLRRNTPLAWLWPHWPSKGSHGQLHVLAANMGDSGVTFARLGSQKPCSVPVLPLWVSVPCCGVGEQDRSLVLLGALLGQAPSASRRVQEGQASTCVSLHAAISPDLSLPPLPPGAVGLQGLSRAPTPESGAECAEGESQSSTVN